MTEEEFRQRFIDLLDAQDRGEDITEVYNALEDEALASGLTEGQINAIIDRSSELAQAGQALSRATHPLPQVPQGGEQPWWKRELGALFPPGKSFRSNFYENVPAGQPPAGGQALLAGPPPFEAGPNQRWSLERGTPHLDAEGNTVVGQDWVLYGESPNGATVVLAREEVKGYPPVTTKAAPAAPRYQVIDIVISEDAQGNEISQKVRYNLDTGRNEGIIGEPFISKYATKPEGPKVGDDVLVDPSTGASYLVSYTQDPLTGEKTYDWERAQLAKAPEGAKKTYGKDTYQDPTTGISYEQDYELDPNTGQHIPTGTPRQVGGYKAPATPKGKRSADAKTWEDKEGNKWAQERVWNEDTGAYENEGEPYIYDYAAPEQPSKKQGDSFTVEDPATGTIYQQFYTFDPDTGRYEFGDKVPVGQSGRRQEEELRRSQEKARFGQQSWDWLTGIMGQMLSQQNQQELAGLESQQRYGLADLEAQQAAAQLGAYESLTGAQGQLARTGPQPPNIDWQRAWKEWPRR